MLSSKRPWLRNFGAPAMSWPSLAEIRRPCKRPGATAFACIAYVRVMTTGEEFVHAAIVAADIPRMKSGKIVELAVREVVHGRSVKNREALANPQALDLFAGLTDLKA